MNLELLFRFTALTYLGLLAAGLLMPGSVDLWNHTRELPPFIRQLFKVYYVFIGFILVSFGLITWIFAAELAAGSPLARGICLMMAIFWTIRLVVATCVFDVRPYLKTKWHHLGYAATNVVFGLLPFIYTLVVITP